MVVMDFVDGEPPVDSLSNGQLAQVKQTTELLHSYNLVFGDLRASNILVKDESVMFVGVVRPGEPWPSAVISNLVGQWV
jgi:tRNA A-37 threonylcarbamoyl transferase component Bud32